MSDENSTLSNSNKYFSDTDCSICFEKCSILTDYTTKCGHIFHKKCVEEWFKKGEVTCPNCRSVDIKQSKKITYYLNINSLPITIFVYCNRDLQENIKTNLTPRSVCILDEKKTNRKDLMSILYSDEISIKDNKIIVEGLNFIQNKKFNIPMKHIYKMHICKKSIAFYIMTFLTLEFKDESPISKINFTFPYDINSYLIDVFIKQIEEQIS